MSVDVLTADNMDVYTMALYVYGLNGFICFLNLPSSSFLKHFTHWYNPYRLCKTKTVKTLFGFQNSKFKTTLHFVKQLVFFN